MTKREAKRLARLVILHEVTASLQCSDEWACHPENGDDFSVKEIDMLKREGWLFRDELERRALRAPGVTKDSG